MGFHYRDGIAVLDLVVYPPILVAALILAFRFGWKSAVSCWRFVIILCLLRIIAASCILALLNHYSITVVKTYAVCDLIGISPLTLTALGLLAQVNEAVLFLPKKYFHIIGLVSLSGLVIGIIGIGHSNNHGTYHPSNSVKAAMGIFLAVYAVLVLFTLRIGSKWGQLQTKTQRNSVLAVAISLPFILVRLIYAAIADFGNNTDFSVLTGNPTIYLCMSVLEEIAVMIICVGFGFTFERPHHHTAEVGHDDQSHGLSHRPKGVPADV